MENYQFERGQITIIDPELSLDIQESFDPVLLPRDPSHVETIGNGYQVKKLGVGEFAVAKDQVLQGQYCFYYPSGQLKGDMYYLDGELHGPSKHYSEKGKLLSHSWFIRGVKQGRCHWYYPNGQLYALQRFKDGAWHGKQEYYFQDGRLKTALEYAEGQLVKAILYCKDGSVERTLNP